MEGTGMNSRNHHMFSSFSAYLVTSVAGLGQAADGGGYRDLDLRASGAYALHAANASLELAHGVTRFWWERSGGEQSDKAAEAPTLMGPHRWDPTDGTPPMGPH